MKKIPVQISEENIDYINKNNLSFAQTINALIDILRNNNINKETLNSLRANIQKGEINESLQRLPQRN